MNVERNIPFSPPDVSEEEIAEEISAIMTVYGYASEEELQEDMDEESIKEDMMRKKVVAFLKENGNIQGTSPAE